ncbi:MAG: ABC transporter substrate-binding protein [Pseudomonadota bacterium]
MTAEMMTGRGLHPMAPPLVDGLRRGELSRREYLAAMMALGVTSAAAVSLGGLARAQTEQAPVTAPKQGGTLRIAMDSRDLKDPRLFDWSEMGNVARQSLEYLIRWERDYSFTPWLLESWELNDTATEVVLNLRQGVTWSNGDAFTAEDVAFNLNRWCDKGVLGNSMAGRMASLIDPDTGLARDGAIQIVDDHTIRLVTGYPDITLIPGLADYPAAIVHRSFDPEGDLLAQINIGTGPYDITRWEMGVGAAAAKRPTWWGEAVFGPALLDGIEWIDLGTDPSATVAALAAGEVDCNHQTLSDARDQMSSLGLALSEATTAATIVCRFNVNVPPYDDQRVRNAMQAAVDNSVVLALGYDGAGEVAENHHVGPMHPEYFALPKPTRDVERAQALLAEAGQTDHEFELISIDDLWRRNTTDAIAAQMRDAGMKVRRKVIPSANFWNDWAKYPLSTTNWNPRPLGVQVLALAYRSGEAWNETGYANPAFDERLNQAMGTVDVEARRALMQEIQSILQDSGVILQPYWRKVYRHAKPDVQGFPAHQALEQHLEKVWLDREG